MDTAGIPEAIDTNGQRFGRSAIDRDPMPFDCRALHCGGCTAPVTATRSHERQGRHVGAYYRLKSRQTYPHDESCRYDWGARTGILVSESRTVLSKRRDYFELRLPDGHVDQPTTPPTQSGSAKRSVQVQVRRDTDRVLPRVLATARGIARLLADMQDPELAGQFRANHQGELIGWDDFFIDLTDLATYPQQLRNLHRLATAHPLAVAGMVLRHAHTSKGMPYIALGQSRPGVRSDDPAGWLHARIISTTIDLAGHQDGHQVLAYGTWKTLPRADNQGNVWTTLFLDDPCAIMSLKN